MLSNDFRLAGKAHCMQTGWIHIGEVSICIGAIDNIAGILYDLAEARLRFPVTGSRPVFARSDVRRRFLREQRVRLHKTEAGAGS